MSFNRPLPPNIPTRADAAGWAAAQSETLAGLSPLTNTKIGLAQPPAKTNKTSKTGGVV